MMRNPLRRCFFKDFREREGFCRCVLSMTIVFCCFLRGVRADEVTSAKPVEPRLGFYLHACWIYNYPFAERTWQRQDYDAMFQLLKRFGYNTVMLFPVTETVPPPISQSDRRDLTQFRQIIEDGRQYGLDTWLVICAVVTRPEMAAKPWKQRALYPYMKTVRLDHPQEAEAYLKYRAEIIKILNNADGYVLIDGDPGSYPGAKPEEYLRVLLADRKTIDRVGTHPRTQKVIPWIWAGWGMKNPWVDVKTREPFVTASLEAIKQKQKDLEPWELLPGRHAQEGYGSGRGNFDCVKKAGLLDRSSLICYDTIEFEPSTPGSWLRFTDIRRVLKQERELSPGNRGWFGNAQTPILMLPNIYFFARGAADPRYLDQSDEKVLTDLAKELGGPPELLIPAWSCLQRGLDRLPADLPEKLRAAELTGPASAFLPGGASRYLEILADQAEARIRLLQACRQSAKTPEEAAAAIAEGTDALVKWWRLVGYRGIESEGQEPFAWGAVHGSLVGPLKDWCNKNVSNPDLVSKLAVKKLVERGTLGESLAQDRMHELLAR
jgi:hypothetical protein